MVRSFSSSETHFRLIKSETSVGQDGYRKGEPKAMECASCGAKVPITREPSVSIEELPHCSNCDQRDVKSEYWIERFLDD
ncbi:hypothetical protein C453_12821 [Haloferax elongans ATCC BAA-1513]|uniref:Uncharacterized protein n=1 Tax=Haloferax elongans ATCC BAA-1513 TaxID=1230453 RepID=M0HMU8_HALEO|nr:hypothetical protein C453_12821 [Haloferax elongans ATCC BAA-1513]